MTGTRLATTGSADTKFDIYATTDPTSIKILGGARNASGTWDIQLSNVAAVGLPASGSVDVQAWQFPYGSGYFDSPQVVDAGMKSVSYVGGDIVFAVDVMNTTAYAFEIKIGSGWNGWGAT
jgi:hypothetical protein